MAPPPPPPILSPATGVNLPAYLVVVKGTRRWTNEPGSPPGFVEYAPSDVHQMLGRAGRPQFDDRGVGVVMTRQGAAATALASLVGGAGTPLASRLADALADHLNAEIVLRTVADVEGAAAWFRRTFLWARILADPAGAGFPADAPPDALERLAVQRHVSAALAALTAAGLARAENWSASTEFDEFLRASIDPAWPGDMPRTLLISPSGQVKTIPGTAQMSEVERWLETVER